MKLRFDPEVEAFRDELRSWLADNRPTPEEMAAEPSRSTGPAPGWARRWTRRMFDAGWLVPGWPAELGGRGAGPVQTLVYLEELAAAGVPRTTNVQGLGIVAPTIVEHGTPEQVRDHALPLLRGETTACLGMSEPGAGSDLAALATRAVLDGDPDTGEWVIDGQKVWTSGAAHADLCLLFCRTEPDEPKHRGISIVLLPMAHRITVRPKDRPPRGPRPVRVFLDGVRVRPQPARRARRRRAMANSSLANERHGLGERGVGLEEAKDRLLDRRPGCRHGVTERALAVTRRRHAIDTRPPAASATGVRQAGPWRDRPRAGPHEALCQRLPPTHLSAQRSGGPAVGVVPDDGHHAVDGPADVARAVVRLVRQRSRRHQRDPAQHHRRACWASPRVTAPG